MQTPLRRNKAAADFVSALELVLETIDDSLAAESDGRGVNEIQVQRRLLSAAKKFHHSPLRRKNVVDIAKTIAERLSPVDVVLLGTGVCLRQRSLLLETIRNRIRNTPSREAIQFQHESVMAASTREYLETPDWPDYLRTLAALLLIIAEIWEWFQ